MYFSVFIPPDTENGSQDSQLEQLHAQHETPSSPACLPHWRRSFHVAQWIMHMEEEKKKKTLRCLYNEGNVFVQFVLLGESPSYFLYLKGAEDARFDFSATENDAEMILRLIWEWVMNNQLLSYSCWGPSSLWWMTLSIPVVPFRSIDLSLRHVSTTWPGHYGCDPDARGQYQRSCYPSQGAAGSEAKLSQKRDT